MNNTRNETIRMTPEEFADRWLVVDWMAAKVELAKQENTLLEVELERTFRGRYVRSLSVVLN